MWAYLLRRLIQAVLILLGVSFITFLLLYVLPADPVRQIAGRSATPQVVESIRRELGLDQPFLVQYWNYLTGLVQGDLGRSYLQKADVAGLIASRLPATLQLMALAIVFELTGVIVVGALSLLAPALFGHDSVWSYFGMGYLFIPAVLPFLGLWWLLGFVFLFRIPRGITPGEDAEERLLERLARR